MQKRERLQLRVEKILRKREQDMFEIPDLQNWTHDCRSLGKSSPTSIPIVRISIDIAEGESYKVIWNWRSGWAVSGCILPLRSPACSVELIFSAHSCLHLRPKYRDATVEEREQRISAAQASVRKKCWCGDARAGPPVASFRAALEIRSISGPPDGLNSWLSVTYHPRWLSFLALQNTCFGDVLHEATSTFVGPSLFTCQQ